MTGWPDRPIHVLAARQRAVVSRQQLLALGAKGAAIDDAIARGRLHRLHQGIYALVDPDALPPLAREQAALLACGPHAVLSHRSAAKLHGLRVPTDGPVAVTIPEGDRRRPGIEIHRVRRLDGADVRRVHGLVTTTLARALIDVAPQLGLRQLERALDEALATRLTSRTAVRDALRRTPHAALQSLIAPRPTTLTRSEAEERLLALIRRSGLPTPATNVDLDGVEVDLLWRAERVVVEVDGFAFHGSRAAFERDRRRDARLQRAGYTVIRVSFAQITREPEMVLVAIATALARTQAASA